MPAAPTAAAVTTTSKGSQSPPTAARCMALRASGGVAGRRLRPGERRRDTQAMSRRSRQPAGGVHHGGRGLRPQLGFGESRRGRRGQRLHRRFQRRRGRDLHPGRRRHADVDELPEFHRDAGGTPPICTHDYRLQLRPAVMVSPDGRNVYALAARSNPKQGSQDIAIYGRDLGTGAITPLPDPNSCWADSDTGLRAGARRRTACRSDRDGVQPGRRPAVRGRQQRPGRRGGSPPGGIAIFNREIPPTCAPRQRAPRPGRR